MDLLDCSPPHNTSPQGPLVAKPCYKRPFKKPSDFRKMLIRVNKFGLVTFKFQTKVRSLFSKQAFSTLDCWNKKLSMKKISEDFSPFQ